MHTSSRGYLHAFALLLGHKTFVLEPCTSSVNSCLFGFAIPVDCGKHCMH